MKMFSWCHNIVFLLVITISSGKCDSTNDKSNNSIGIETTTPFISENEVPRPIQVNNFEDYSDTLEKSVLPTSLYTSKDDQELKSVTPTVLQEAGPHHYAFSNQKGSRGNHRRGRHRSRSRINDFPSVHAPERLFRNVINLGSGIISRSLNVLFDKNHNDDYEDRDDEHEYGSSEQLFTATTPGEGVNSGQHSQSGRRLGLHGLLGNVVDRLQIKHNRIINGVHGPRDGTSLNQRLRHLNPIQHLSSRFISKQLKLQRWREVKDEYRRKELDRRISHFSDTSGDIAVRNLRNILWGLVNRMEKHTETMQIMVDYRRQRLKRFMEIPLVASILQPVLSNKNVPSSGTENNTSSSSSSTEGHRVTLDDSEISRIAGENPLLQFNPWEIMRRKIRKLANVMSAILN